MYLQMHRRKYIQNSDPGKILDLVMSLTDDTCAELQIKINTYLKDECEADLVFQIVLLGGWTEASVEVIGLSILPRRIKLKMSSKIKESLKGNAEISDLLVNFDAEFQNIVIPHLPHDYAKKRVVMFSIPDKPFAVIFFVVGGTLQENHVAMMVQECSLFVWPTLKKSIAFEYERTLKQKCQMLLHVARRLFTQVTWFANIAHKEVVASLETLLQITMEQAKQLTNAERCTVLLIDTDRMELYEYCNNNNKVSQLTEGGKARRFPLNIGVTGEVIRTGTIIKIENTKDHPLFDPKIDSLPGFDCRNLLCFPIREASGIIGVGLLMNKIQDPYFDSMDEEMAQAFSIYSGMCIIHSVVYQRIQEAHIRNALANELVMYHMKVSDQEVSRILDCKGLHNNPHIVTLNFNHRVLPLRELPCYVLKMFSDLGFDKTFNITRNKLARFILYVKKGYRDVPYHNWVHGFNTAQWAYAALIQFKLVNQGYFSELRAFMYFLAGLMHDLDHRGTTNSFQIAGETTLAALYSSEGSVMERHHLAQAMCILNTEGCDILESLSRRDYDRALLLLRDFILATDLATYFENLHEYKAISMDFQKSKKTHTNALSSMLMNCADLSDQIMEWAYIKRSAAAILTEFFMQGDIEKSRGQLPAAIMDRDKCFIPDLQIQFLQTVTIPLFETVGRILAKTDPITEILESHMEKWDGSKPVFAEVPVPAGLSVLLSPELDNLIELNIKEKELERQRLERLKEEEEEANQEA